MTTTTNTIGDVVVFIRKIASTFIAITLIPMFMNILVTAFKAHDPSGIAVCLIVVGLMGATVWAIWSPSKRK